MAQQPRLSFVLPAYNEEAFIEGALRGLDAAVKGGGLPYEVVVVDDGSVDRTFAVASAYAVRNGHVKVIRYDRNMGKGYAVKTGFLNASGDVVVFADSDLEVDLHEVSRYVAALQYGDIVVASKWHPASRVEVPLSRRFLSCGFNVLVRFLTGVPLRDTQSGLKAMRKSAFAKVFPRLAVKRYAFDVELLAVAHLYRLKVVEMPVSVKLEASFSLREVGKMFVDLLGVAYRLRVIHWYQRQGAPAKTGLQRLASFVFREA